MARFINIDPGHYTKSRGSPAHALDARLKVIMAGVLSVAVWSIDTPLGLAMISAPVAVWVSMLKGQARAIVSSLSFLVYLFVIVLLYYGWTELSSGAAVSRAAALEQALIRSSLLTGKLAVVFIAAFWLYFSTAPMRVVEALGDLLSCLERFRLPVKEFAFVVGLIMRFFPASVRRIGDLYRNFALREKLAREKPLGLPGKSGRAVQRVIDTMVCYMHYSLYEARLLSLSLMARGYNPFRPVRLTPERRPAPWELAVFGFSTATIILTPCWL